MMTVQNRSVDTGYSSENAFIEAHYYDGGLRHRAIATSADRPKWAPAADFVGFRDEIKLQHDELAVEIVKFSNKTSSVCWLGVYGLAPDAKYGNRNNHAGVGIWLRDLFPHDGEVLIDGLCSLLNKLRDSSFDEFAEASKKFIIGFLEKIVSAYVQLEAPLTGMIPATSQTYATIGLNVPRSEGYHSRLNSAVYRAFFLAPNHEEASRLLLHIHTGKGAFGAVAQDDFSTDIVRVLPAAFSQQAAMMDGLKAVLAKLEAERDELDATIDKLEADKRNLADNLAVTKREHEELRKAVEEDDELQRYSRLNDGLIQIRRSIEGVERSLPDIQRNLAREFQNVVASVRQPNDYGYRNPPQTNTRRQEPAPPEGDWNWPLIMLLAVIFITLTVSGYLIYRMLSA
jgi:hypothetical protein